MGLETATYIHELNSSQPGAVDEVNQGDDHLRLIKATVKATFPNITGAVTASHTELNYVDGVTSSIQSQLDVLAAAVDALATGEVDFSDIWAALALKAPLDSPTFTTLAVLPSNTTIGSVTPTELGYLSGVTSSLQTQLGTKAPLASPTFTGTVTLPATTSVGPVSSTELGYLDGVTSALQTQLNAKASSTHTHAATDIVSGIFADARISLSSVSQHQFNLAINATQIIHGVVSTSSTSFSVASGYAEDIVRLTGASAIGINVGDGHGFVAGQSVAFERYTSNTVTFSASGSQTIASPGSRLTIPEQYGTAVLTYHGSNSWTLSGV